jgi:phenylacetate-CoA ligase
MTKAEMMASLDDVFTDRRLNRGLVEQALAATTTGTHPRPVHRSGFGWRLGSARGLCLRPAGHGRLPLVAVPIADGAAGRSRRPPVAGLTIAMVAAASTVHATRCGVAWAAQGGLPFRAVPVPVTLPLPEIVEQLNALQPPLLYGYASMLVRLAAEQRAARLRIAPTSVTSSSETLVPELRAAIAEAFGAPIVDIFGSTEGLVGTTAPDDDVLVFNSDLCIVELVDAENRPVAPGVPSAKVLVTNLFNRTQPLLRYELTDSFVQQPDASDHGHLRATVRGGADEVLHYQDVDIHPHVVRSAMVRSAEILDYQVRQTPVGIQVDVLAVVPVDSHRVADYLVQALAAAGLHNPAVSVRIVDHLERNPDTGKFRRFVPLASVT